MNDEESKRYDAVRDARHAWFKQRLGPLPDTVMKCMGLGPAWPGGGLYHIPADAPSGRLHTYFTDGLTNANMPTTVSVRAEPSPVGGVNHLVSARAPRAVPAGCAGYGFEIVALSESDEPGLLLGLSKLVEMEMLHDVDLLALIAHDGSGTLEDHPVGPWETGDFILQPARAPLPDSVSLPNGSMRVLTLTWITRDEMEFALAQGRPALLERLTAAGIGPASVLGRRSVLDTTPLVPTSPTPESLPNLQERISRLFQAVLACGPQQWDTMRLEGRFTKDAQGRPRTVRAALHGSRGERAVVSSAMQAAAADVTHELFRQGQPWDQWTLDLARKADGGWRVSFQPMGGAPAAPPEPESNVPLTKPCWKFW